MVEEKGKTVSFFAVTAFLGLALLGYFNIVGSSHPPDTATKEKRMVSLLYIAYSAYCQCLPRVSYVNAVESADELMPKLIEEGYLVSKHSYSPSLLKQYVAGRIIFDDGARFRIFVVYSGKDGVFSKPVKRFIDSLKNSPDSTMLDSQLREIVGKAGSKESRDFLGDDSFVASDIIMIRKPCEEESVR